MNMLLEIKNLNVTWGQGSRAARILDDVSLAVQEGEIMALVGGSGSGKTTTGLAILRLMAPELIMTAGQVIFKGTDLARIQESSLRDIRGKEISMVFQEPLNAFNPVLTVGVQISEVLKVHTRIPSRRTLARVLELLDLVGIPDPARVAGEYPHRLSGGMRQRAMIAQAIAAEPQLVIADEPTSNIDVTLQARILELFRDLRQKLGLSILLITHDLGVVGHLTDRVAVMSGGRIVERGMTAQVLRDPQHAYTQKLLEALKD